MTTAEKENAAMHQLNSADLKINVFPRKNAVLKDGNSVLLEIYAS
jgi:hypothetical protein